MDVANLIMQTFTTESDGCEPCRMFQKVFYFHSSHSFSNSSCLWTFWMEISVEIIHPLQTSIEWRYVHSNKFLSVSIFWRQRSSWKETYLHFNLIRVMSFSRHTLLFFHRLKMCLMWRPLYSLTIFFEEYRIKVNDGYG